MTAWTTNELAAIAAADELEIAPLRPDGTVSVYGPDGQVQHSHSPPPPATRAV